MSLSGNHFADKRQFASEKLSFGTGLSLQVGLCRAGSPCAIKDIARLERMTALFELTNAADSKAGPANILVRRFSNRYLMVLIAVALLVVTDQAVVQPLLLRLNAYAPAIDLAGRQR